MYWCKFFNLEVNLIGHRPSAIAAASALLALDDRLTRRALEMKMNSISHRRFLEIVSPFYGYLYLYFILKLISLIWFNKKK